MPMQTEGITIYYKYISIIIICVGYLKVIWKANIVEFLDLICHLILTKTNCITLKIRPKADFKSKSQNIWQQIIPVQ